MGPPCIRRAHAFQTKPELGQALIERASTFAIDRAPVLGDAAYGDSTKLRSALDGKEIHYVLSIKPETTIFEPYAVCQVPVRRPGRSYTSQGLYTVYACLPEQCERRRLRASTSASDDFQAPRLRMARRLFAPRNAEMSRLRGA